MVTQEFQSERSNERPPLQGLLTLNISTKIVLPYLILTFAIAAVGTYVVTSLVAGSLDERLTNHLLEAGRVVSDNLARQEIKHIEAARLVAFTRGLAEALQEGREEDVMALAQPAAAGSGIDCLILVDATGKEMLHLIEADGGALQPVSTKAYVANFWLVGSVLDSSDEELPLRRALGLHPVDNRYYYFTAVPVKLNSRLAGAAVVGTPLDELTVQFKANALADVVIYLDPGKIVASTLMGGEQGGGTSASPDRLTISEEQYVQLLHAPDVTFGENVEILGRTYRLARGPLQVGSETLGVFGVVLPSQFIVEAGAASRTTYALLFGLATAAVIGIGILIARRITSPLARLVTTSRAVAEGELDRRTGIRSADEIGILASTFDEMTGRLEERTLELQRLLQVYKEASGRMEAILLSIGDGVILEDLQGNFVPLNPAAEELLQEMGEGDQVDVNSLRKMLPDPGSHLADGEAGPWTEERRRLEIGRRVLDIHSAPVHTDEGEYLGRVVVLRDVTAEAEAERLKDAFVSHVSHELRTPLTAINGYSSLLVAHAADALGKQMYGFVETIHRNANDLVSMVDQLLELSEMEARGRLAVRPQPGDIRPLIEEVVDRWQEHMAEKSLEFHVDVPDDLPQANVDLRRLRWALIALVRNAWQYTPEGGAVTVCAEAVDGHLRVDVSDTGCGIGSEELKYLFTRFHRRTNLEGGEARGLGLGLYLTHAIVEAHDGVIHVASEEGVGSTFSIVLPILSADTSTSRVT